MSSLNGLAKAFDATGLKMYLLTLTKMPQYSGDWPEIKDMVVDNQRLVVFTSNESKQESEGIAYQWNFMVAYKCKQIQCPSIPLGMDKNMSIKFNVCAFLCSHSIVLVHRWKSGKAYIEL